jgi:signal transduction histidine kinase
MLQFISAISEGAVLVQSNAERAAHLVQSFKQVAVDEISEQRRDIDLNTYIGEVLTSLRPKYKNTRIKVGCSCPEGVVMDTYPGLLAQVLTNLITNALVHGFDEGAEGEIAIRAWVEGGDWVNIECANSGKPISAEDLPKIFEPFFTTRRSSGGTGLGLNIVFNIVTQKLGGTIAVASAVGEQTKFTVRIPRVSGDKAGDGRQK